MYGYLLEEIDQLVTIEAQGPEGFGGTFLALPFVPLTPGLLRQIRKQMVFL